MICDICKKNQADISVEQVVDKKVKHLFLCRECAKKMGFEMFSENIDISITNLFNKYSKYGTEKPPTEYNHIACPYCGRKLSDLKDSKKIGCPNCFLYFKSEILTALKKVKTDIRYTGKVQSSENKEFALQLSIAELKQRLQRALETEEYEQAAMLRDELKALEKKNGIET